MKITLPLIDKLLRLRSGESLPSSALRGDWVEELLRDGVQVSRSQGSRRTLMAADPVKLELALGGIDERLGGLERMKKVQLNASATSHPVQTVDIARASFLIPTDIEQRLLHGSAERYREQYPRFRNLTTYIPSLQKLIYLIHRYRRGYDQEGYIR